MKRKSKSKRDVTIKVGEFDVTVPKSKRRNAKSDGVSSLISRAIAKRGLHSAVKREIRAMLEDAINDAMGPKTKRRRRRKSK